MIVGRILKYLRPYWLLAACAVLLVLISAGAGLLAPLPVKILVDHVLSGQPLPAWMARVSPIADSDRGSWLVVAVVGGFLVALLANSVTVLTNYVSAKLEQWMVLDFRSDLFRHSQRLSMTFYDSQRS